MREPLVRRAVLWYSVRNRHRKADLIVSVIRAEGLRTVILSGVGAGGGVNEMIVEGRIGEEAQVVGGFDIKRRSRGVPWPFVMCDGRSLAFTEGAVDLIVSNAVIEHVGDVDDQVRFVSEHRRVARCCIITTPNRWFPVESHTSAIFRHWSPSWRAGRPEFTRLLSLREFRRLLPPGTVVHGRPWNSTFVAVVTSGPVADSN